MAAEWPPNGRPNGRLTQALPNTAIHLWGSTYVLPPMRRIRETFLLTAWLYFVTFFFVDAYGVFALNEMFVFDSAVFGGAFQRRMRSEADISSDIC